MTSIILFDSYRREHFLPLTYLRPLARLRMGIETLAEKWQRALSSPVSFATPPYLQKKYGLHLEEENLLIDGGILPDEAFVEALRSLAPRAALWIGDEPVAFRLDKAAAERFIAKLPGIERDEYGSAKPCSPTLSPRMLRALPDLFVHNAAEIRKDFAIITSHRKSQPIPPSNTVLGNPGDIFIEEGAVVEGAFLDSRKGPIYIGKGVEIMPCAVIQGEAVLCDHTLVKPGARISNACTIGPCCKVGGELENVVMQGYSNKAHDGYLGHAVVGEWCNIGAGSDFSNLQNNYQTVKQWHYPSKDFRDTGLQFCGVVLGDHTKCGIHSMFNCGAVVGICCNLFGTGFHPGFIPSFSCGRKNGEYATHPLETVLRTETLTHQRRAVELTETDQGILAHVFNYITSVNNKKD